MIHVEKFTVLNFLLLLVTLLVHKVFSSNYFVIPDDYSLHNTDANTFSLQHYLNNTSKYLHLTISYISCKVSIILIII